MSDVSWHYHENFRKIAEVELVENLPSMYLSYRFQHHFSNMPKRRYKQYEPHQRPPPKKKTTTKNKNKQTKTTTTKNNNKKTKTKNKSKQTTTIRKQQQQTNNKKKKLNKQTTTTTITFATILNSALSCCYNCLERLKTRESCARMSFRYHDVRLQAS